MSITFTVPGDPVPQPRPRVTSRGKKAWAYTPAGEPIHAYRQAITLAAKAAGLEPLGHSLNVVIDAVFERPKSHSTKAGLKPTAPALPRPDVDNIAKAVLDALQDVIGDDSCVGRLVVEKSYGPEARTTVRVS